MGSEVFGFCSVCSVFGRNKTRSTGVDRGGRSVSVRFYRGGTEVGYHYKGFFKFGFCSVFVRFLSDFRGV